MAKLGEARRKYTGARLDSKQVRDAVKAYLEEENECTVADLYKHFKSEYGWAIPKMGEQKALVEWLRGVSINCEIYTNGIVELMAKWTGDSVESQEQYIDERGDDVYWILLAREIYRGKKDAEAMTESKKSLKESDHDSEVYNAWLLELNDLCEDVNSDCGDQDALFFGRAGFPNAFVKGKKLDQMVEDGEAEDLSTAFAIIADDYTNANFTYDLVDDDEKHHEIEISMGGQKETLGLDESKKKSKKDDKEKTPECFKKRGFKKSPMTEAFEEVYKSEKAFRESINDELLGKSEDEYYSLYLSDCRTANHEEDPHYELELCEDGYVAETVRTDDSDCKKVVDEWINDYGIDVDNEKLEEIFENN